MSTLFDRFEAKHIPEPNSGCFLWFGAYDPVGGYGYIAGGRGKQELAHRVSYELFVGPIPDGLQIDHKCRMRCCVNPSHLEPVTCKVNIGRGNTGLAAARRQLAKTHCSNGHPYIDENTYRGPGREGRGRRTCRTCMVVYEQRRRDKKVFRAD